MIPGRSSPGSRAASLAPRPRDIGGAGADDAIGDRNTRPAVSVLRLALQASRLRYQLQRCLAASEFPRLVRRSAIDYFLLGDRRAAQCGGPILSSARSSALAVDSLRSDKIWMDGVLVPYDQANVHVLTHSLHYGLAVFEGMRCYQDDDGRSAIFRGREHIRRLLESAHIVEMPVPYSQEELLKACADVARTNKLAECYLRPLVFYGEGEMGLAARGNKSRVAIAAWKWGAYLGTEGLTKGVRLKTSSFVRFHHNSMMPAAKASGHYVNSILAGYEARRGGYDEALLLDTEGYVAEGSGENVFVIRDGIVRTPPLSSILPGITRDAVIRILRDGGIEVREELFARDAFYIADEAFMTGTAAEVTPVVELDDRKIASGTPGPITRKVQHVFEAALHGREPKYRGWLYYI
ncbi:MAG: branched-chain amino acid transaminase [Deltaproteobacteria bacterium]|nr:branched-chain amino acid transaminase [Deltaproteobacteria bacterium]